MTNDTALEKHYTIGEVAKMWHCGYETVRRQVLADPDGILQFSGISGKTTYKIPESVVRRLHTRLTMPRRRPKLVSAK